MTFVPAFAATPKPVQDDKPRTSAKPSTPSNTPLPTIAVRSVGSDTKPLSGIKIGIDPGHQGKANNKLEPVGPGSSTEKKGVSSGTQGRFTRVPEYKVTLEVGLMLKEMLKEKGATVVMTRERNDINITNVERAKLMNKEQVDIWIRLHCNGSNKESVNGAFILIPSGKFCKPIAAESKKAAEYVLKAFIKETGAKNLGLTPRSDQTGFNWSTQPVINIEMGHMTNKTEDNNLTNKDYQKKCATGIANGFIDYYNSKIK